MNKNYYFKVAGLNFQLDLPDFVEVERMLPTFGPFHLSCKPDGEMLFRFTCTEKDLKQVIRQGSEQYSSDFDGGHARLFRLDDGYGFALRYYESPVESYLKLSDSYSEAYAQMDWTDGHAASILNSMIRIVFAQSCLSQQAISVHASAVVMDGKSYLFMGKSGTGKSTHSNMWRRAFGPKVKLLNDDNPIVRFTQDGPMAYGSPWSGKRDCYRNEGYPIGAMVRLAQAPVDCYKSLSGADAFTAVFPGCSVLRTSKDRNDLMVQTLITLIRHVQIGLLECLPHEEAASLCFKNMVNNQNRQ